MFYFYFLLPEDQKKIRELRIKLPAEIRATAERFLKADDAEKEKINVELQSLRAQATNDVMNSVCGDKEILNILLSTSPNLRSSQDIVKYSRIDQILQKTVDPDWIILEDEIYKWIVSMVTHDHYNQTVSDQQGNHIAIFPTQLKLVIGNFLARFMTAKETMPEELKLSLVKKETDGTKETDSINDSMKELQ